MTYKLYKNIDESNAGLTEKDANENGANITVSINEKYKERSNVYSNVDTFFHESFIHAENNAQDYLDNKKFDYSNLGLTDKQRAEVLNRPGQYHHKKVADDYLKYQNNSSNLWPIEAYRGLVEANNILHTNYTQMYIFKRMWNYVGGLNVEP
ncbi:hypothetical protein [Arsenicibacter rosenii]|uniref:Uncharacterized protein n=1 Tax=Arsenicibacter rosenii TaxID=1750698 RepID=A0A1S2VBC9_9BACT|nr:hypothetical protein [Arsenicibacter rosenii]OIN55615.1 hypothetical protein BLX24_29175 [Arsenicibacter rosenii]